MMLWNIIQSFVFLSKKKEPAEKKLFYGERKKLYKRILNGDGNKLFLYPWAFFAHKLTLLNYNYCSHLTTYESTQSFFQTNTQGIILSFIRLLVSVQTYGKKYIFTLCLFSQPKYMPTV